MLGDGREASQRRPAHREFEIDRFRAGFMTACSSVDIGLAGLDVQS